MACNHSSMARRRLRRSRNREIMKGSDTNTVTFFNEEEEETQQDTVEEQEDQEEQEEGEEDTSRL